MRAVLSSLSMVLAMVNAPGDPASDEPAVRPPAADVPERVFPVDGPHTYGDGFGDRPNHRGQDLMAACGTRLRAPSRGTVRLVDEEGSAGRYVVLRTASGAEVVLMHLQDVDVTGGERVTTGEGVGTVGRTGNASACHLHIERWSAPGWYAGGTPVDPSAMLRLQERSGAGRVP